MRASSDRSMGFIYGFLAYFSWGLFPIYWKFLKEVPAEEILAHRIIWSVVVTAIFLFAARSWGELRGGIRARNGAVYLSLSAALIGLNWLLYIWAVNTDHILEASLAYFMTPIVNILLGATILKESLSRAQRLALGCGVLAVLLLTVELGSLPALSLSLAVSFALYGFIRKKAPIGALPGLAAEAMILSPLALAFLAKVEMSGVGHFWSLAPTGKTLLLLSGFVTSLPLIWFAAAARALPLSILGLLQYIAPTLQFLTAIFIYGEKCSPAQEAAFVLVWVGLGAVAMERLRRKPEPA